MANENQSTSRENRKGRTDEAGDQLEIEIGGESGTLVRAGLDINLETAVLVGDRFEYSAGVASELYLQGMIEVTAEFREKLPDYRFFADAELDLPLLTDAEFWPDYDRPDGESLFFDSGDELQSLTRLNLGVEKKGHGKCKVPEELQVDPDSVPFDRQEVLAFLDDDQQVRVFAYETPGRFDNAADTASKVFFPTAYAVVEGQGEVLYRIDVNQISGMRLSGRIESPVEELVWKETSVTIDSDIEEVVAAIREYTTFSPGRPQTADVRRFWE